MPYRPYKNCPSEDLYLMLRELNDELEQSPSRGGALRQLTLIEDELETREWD